MMFTMKLSPCSVLGAIVIILGLYVVLWGKADDSSSEGLAIRSEDSESILEQDCMSVKVESGTNLSEPLLLSDENADADASRCQ